MDLCFFGDIAGAKMERIPEPESISDMAVARRFDQFMRGHHFRQREYRRLARRAGEMGVPRGGWVLDIGTGPGFLGIEVARRCRGSGCQVVGLDLSGAMLELAARNACRRSLDDRLTWLQADARTIPFNDGAFDLVVSSDSLHHWQEPWLVLDEIARVLRADGKYLIHDLKRPQQWLSQLLSWLIGMSVPPDVRRQYQSSIRAAYTSHELGAILRCSRLEGGGIREEIFDITLEGRLGQAATGDGSLITGL